MKKCKEEKIEDKRYKRHRNVLKYNKYHKIKKKKCSREEYVMKQ